MSSTQEKLVMELVDEICDYDEYCGDENCSKCGGVIRHWKKKLTALIESAKREELIKIHTFHEGRFMTIEDRIKELEQSEESE